MPQKTVFIRDGDIDKWNSIEKKSEFIHNALNNLWDSGEIRATSVIETNRDGIVDEKHWVNGVKVTPKTVNEVEFVPRPPDPELGYPCCSKKTPCKHWVWNQDKALYVNSLTGKEREPDI